MRVGGLRAGLALVAAVGAGCAGSGAQAPDATALMQREVELPEPVAFASVDGAIRGAARGTLLEELAENEGGWYGAFDIGTAGPIECQFYPEGGDAAASLKNLAAGFFEALEAQSESLERQIASVAAGTIDDVPYLTTDWIAVIDGSAYQVTFRFANAASVGVFCRHGENGYAATFDTFYRELVQSIESVPRESVYRDVSLISISGRPIGYQQTAAVIDEDGDYRFDLRGAMLIPNGPSELIANDDYGVEFSRPDGSLINQVAIESDGLAVTQLALSEGDGGGAWQVAGEMQGKPVEATFLVPSPLLSSLGELQLLRGLAKQETGTEKRYRRWLGTANPTEAIEVVAVAAGDSRVSVSAGPVVSEALVDRYGIVSGTLEIGRLQMQVERVFREGEL